jgi:hypothetical protein
MLYRKNDFHVCKICGRVFEKDKKGRNTDNQARCVEIFGVHEKQAKSRKCVPQFLPCGS